MASCCRPIPVHTQTQTTAHTAHRRASATEHTVFEWATKICNETIIITILFAHFSSRIFIYHLVIITTMMFNTRLYSVTKHFILIVQNDLQSERNSLLLLNLNGWLVYK